MKHFASKRQASAFFGVSTQALDGWFTAGCPVHERDKDGRIKTLDLSALARWRINRKDTESALEKQRTRLTKAQADKTELEVAELRGSMIRSSVAVSYWREMVADMRSKLLALPAKLAAAVAQPERAQEAQERAQSLVHDALAEIAREPLPQEIRERVIREANTDASTVAQCEKSALPTPKKGTT